MFSSISGTELLLILVLGLLLFGPRRLPQIGKTVGRSLAEFRRATTDFRLNLEREVDAAEAKSAPDEAGPAARETPGAVPRVALLADRPAASGDDAEKP